ncbi:hypothetical protein [Janthinobacterium sp. B9-8]|uniref:hypothetical protein n=1 Tax=Janthinobacterium sp. B9-8 TaxID=1236179 RepID=UPI00061CE6ED|nr:hypothetical protein [Janthinobacterium sp. B9-8]AMC34375.1 hypothetical protein VN23_07045 [Janthinobacterium sp. B9-8]
MRLETISQELAVFIKKSSIDEGEAVFFAACQVAIVNLDVKNKLINDVFEGMLNGSIISTDLVAELSDFAHEMDENYFDLYGKDKSQALQFFSCARIATALGYMLKEKSVFNIAEAIYEVLMSESEPDRVVEFILLGFVRKK